ncbi:TPA: hypothetical protein ACH3X1_008247 [Trebouxia sp. C0004]
MSGQGAIAHEAVLGGGHVTTWIAVRGHPVDERITALMNDLHSSSTRMHIELEKLVRDHTIHQQVVLLGTGLDTTAWHLAFPPGVAWWIKQVCQTSKSAEKAGAHMQVGLSSKAFPLQSASYTTVAADLADADWTVH